MIFNKEMRGRGSIIHQNIIKPKGLKNLLQVQFTLPRNVPIISNKKIKERGSIIHQKKIKLEG